MFDWLTFLTYRFHSLTGGALAPPVFTSHPIFRLQIRPGPPGHPVSGYRTLGRTARS